MEKPFPGSYPREQEEADNEHSPARATGSTFLLSLLWRLSDAAFADRARGQWKCDTASSGGPEGNGHVDIASIPPREGTDTSVTPPLLQRPTAMATSTFPGCRAVSDTPAKRVGSRPTMTCWSAISTVPVIATGILAWQFALDGQKLRGILLLRLVLGPPARRQCIERRLPWNSGSTLCRCGCAPRDRHGGTPLSQTHYDGHHAGLRYYGRLESAGNNKISHWRHGWRDARHQPDHETGTSPFWRARGHGHDLVRRRSRYRQRRLGDFQKGAPDLSARAGYSKTRRKAQARSRRAGALIREGRHQRRRSGFYGFRPQRSNALISDCVNDLA
jgi:hypothetical protein